MNETYDLYQTANSLYDWLLENNLRELDISDEIWIPFGLAIAQAKPTPSVKKKATGIREISGEEFYNNGLP